jgi:hypothetical protein
MNLDDTITPSEISEAAMTEREQQNRRSSIRNIMSDNALTPLEKRRQIQSLMDGRRRSSCGTGSVSSTGSEDYGYSNTDEKTGEASADNPREEIVQQQHAADVSQVNWSKNTSHVRQRRSASLPGWSEAGMPAAAPALAATSSNTNWDDPINISRRMEKSRPPCSHYERNCTIISPCCGIAFGCRICHDECPVLPMPFSKRQGANEETVGRVNWADTLESKSKQEKRRSLPLGFDDEENHHEIDRFAIKEIICRLCYVRQPSKT